jgi:hypothetical protein
VGGRVFPHVSLALRWSSRLISDIAACLCDHLLPIGTFDSNLKAGVQTLVLQIYNRGLSHLRPVVDLNLFTKSFNLYRAGTFNDTLVGHVNISLAELPANTVRVSADSAHVDIIAH